MYRIAFALLIAINLVACTSDSENLSEATGHKAMAVTSVTRAVDGRTSSNFESGEEVWMWAIKNGTTTEYITAWKLTAQTGGGFSSSSTKYWPSDGSKLDVYALHGNFENSSISEGSHAWSSLSLTHTVATDQSSNVNKRLSDLLYAKTPGATHSNNVELAFDHLLAMITVKLDLSGSQGISNTELANAEVKLTNMLTTGDFKSANVSNIITNGVSANTSGTRKEIKAGVIKQPSAMTSTAYEVGSAIVPLQSFGATNSNKITIKLNDTRSFSYTPTDVTLGKGKEYIYTLKIINGVLSVSSISVNDFITTTQEKKWEIYEDTNP